MPDSVSGARIVALLTALVALAAALAIDPGPADPFAAPKLFALRLLTALAVATATTAAPDACWSMAR